MKSRYIVFGLLFGFVLSRAGATNFDAMVGMFRLTDLHLFGVIGTAVLVSAIGFQLFRRGLLRPRTGERPALQPKPMTRGLILGGLLFGAGWAIAGTCPGTALVQIGEGHLAGIFTFSGILLGAALNRHLQIRVKRHTPKGYVSGKSALAGCGEGSGSTA
ncbi:MAG TPA: DUF6691 family protein [Polyangia bacterium]